MFMRILPFLALLLAGCAAERPPLAVPAEAPAALAKANWSSARRIEVGLESFDFTPDTLRLEKGQPYVLHLENTASIGHNFDAPGFFRTTALADGAVERKLRADGGVVDVDGGAAVDIGLIPLRAGTYPLVCSRPLHEQFGMDGRIIVQ